MGGGTLFDCRVAMRLWQPLVLLCAIPGCAGQDNPPSGDRASRRGVSAETADTCWRATPRLGSLEEPALYEVGPSADIEAVRFLYFPSFHSPVSVRLVRRGETYALVSVSVQLPPDDATPPVPRRDSLPITAAQWAELTAPLRSDAFWVPELRLEDVIHVDGSTWRVEAILQGTCRAVEYWSPEVAGRGAELRAFGTRMLDAAGIVLKEIY